MLIFSTDLQSHGLVITFPTSLDGASAAISARRRDTGEFLGPRGWGRGHTNLPVERVEDDVQVWLSYEITRALYDVSFVQFEVLMLGLSEAADWPPLPKPVSKPAPVPRMEPLAVSPPSKANTSSRALPSRAPVAGKPRRLGRAFLMGLLFVLAAAVPAGLIWYRDLAVAGRSAVEIAALREDVRQAKLAEQNALKASRSVNDTRERSLSEREAALDAEARANDSFKERLDARSLDLNQRDTTLQAQARDILKRETDVAAREQALSRVPAPMSAPAPAAAPAPAPIVEVPTGSPFGAIARTTNRRTYFRSTAATLQAAQQRAMSDCRQSGVCELVAALSDPEQRCFTVSYVPNRPDRWTGVGRSLNDAGERAVAACQERYVDDCRIDRPLNYCIGD